MPWEQTEPFHTQNDQVLQWRSTAHPEQMQVEQPGELSSILSLTSSRDPGYFSNPTSVKAAQSGPSPLKNAFELVQVAGGRGAALPGQQLLPCCCQQAQTSLVSLPEQNALLHWKLSQEFMPQTSQWSKLLKSFKLLKKTVHPGNPRNTKGREKAPFAEVEVTEVLGQRTRVGSWHAGLWCLEEGDWLCHGGFPTSWWKHKNYVG